MLSIWGKVLKLKIIFALKETKDNYTLKGR